MKKYVKLIIGIGFVAILATAVCVMYNHISYIELCENLPSAHVNLKKQVRITKEDKKIYQLALKEKDKLKLNEFFHALDDYLYIDLFIVDDVVYVDFIKEDTRIILCEKNQVLYKYISIDQQIYINSENHEIKIFEIAIDSVDKNVYSQDIAVLDPFFQNEFSINPYLPHKSSSELLQVDYLNKVGINEEQELSVYESQSEFNIISEMGIVYQQGTELACIAMAQKIELQALHDWFGINSIKLDNLQKTTSEVFFCTYQKIKYSVGRFVTCTNPISPYNGSEVLLYKTQEEVQAELKYKKTYTVNKENDIVSVDYIQNPNSVNYCDDYYKSIAIPVFNQMLQNDIKFDLWNAEKDFKEAQQ